MSYEVLLNARYKKSWFRGRGQKVFDFKDESLKKSSISSFSLSLFVVVLEIILVS